MADDDFGEENIADIDFSQIRKSIQLGGRMIEQILNGVHYGSPEVRCLLLDECDIILECKVCRALFRALPNFVAHKRVYCKKAYVIAQENFLKTLPEEDVVVVHPCSPEENAEECPEDTSLQHQTGDEKVQNTIQQITEGNLGKSEMYRLYSKAAEKVERQKKSKKSLDVVLSRIASNPHAVRVEYQEHMETQDTDTSLRDGSLQQSNSASRRKPDQTVRASQATIENVSAKISVTSEKNVIIKEVKEEKKNSREKKSACEERIMLVSPDSEVIPDVKENCKDADMSSVECLQCNTTYSSRKILLDHVQTKHSRMRTFFPCPYCKNVFFYFWGLTRHLRVNHKKTPNQINKMRKALRDSAFTRTVTKTCVQAKDQLAHTADMDTSPQKCSDKPDSVAKNVVPDITKVVSKATVKHTSRSAKHTFASRHVPRIEESTVNSSPPKSPTVLNNGSEKKYAHQLICEWCQKAFWKKVRLTKHKKFCSFAKNAFALPKNTSRKLECPCGKSFLKKIGLLRHAAHCTRKKAGEDGDSQEKDQSTVMFACPFCKRTFGRKSSLENHKRACVSPKTLSRSNSDRAYKTKINNEEICVKDGGLLKDGDVGELKTKPSEKVSNLMKTSPQPVKGAASSETLELQDQQKLTAIVDESAKKCMRCAQKFSNLYYLRCHALRHLGWRRFKCKLCSFSSHKKSDCGVHIMKTHSEMCSTQSTDLYLVDLKLEAPKVLGKSVQSDSGVTKENDLDQLKDSKQSCDQFIISGVDHSRKFNISTRNSPRKFDTRPYKKLDNMSTLFTRKGYYPKRELKSVKTTDSRFTPEHSSRKRHVSETQEIVKTAAVTTSPSNKDNLVENASVGPQRRVDSDGDGRQVKKIEVTVFPSKPPNKCEKVDAKHERLPSSNETKTPDMLAPWPRSPEPMSVEEMFALIRRSPKDGSVVPGRRKSANDLPSVKPKELAQTPGDKQVDKSSQSAPRGRSNLSARVSRKGSPSGNLLSRSMRTNRPGVDWSQNVKKQSKKGSDVGHSSSEDQDLEKQN